MKRTKHNAISAASALLAFQRGEDSNQGYVGALMMVDHQADLRLIRMALGVKLQGE